MIVANISGGSGNGFIVPIALIFFQFDAQNAVALSNFSIFVSAIIRHFMVYKDVHPFKKGKGLLIDQNISILMLPVVISGVTLSVIFNIMMPSLINVATYIVINILIMTNGLIKKMIELWNQETIKLNRIKQVQSLEHEGIELKS